MVHSYFEASLKRIWQAATKEIKVVKEGLKEIKLVKIRTGSNTANSGELQLQRMKSASTCSPHIHKGSERSCEITVYAPLISWLSVEEDTVDERPSLSRISRTVKASNS